MSVPPSIRQLTPDPNYPDVEVPRIVREKERDLQRQIYRSRCEEVEEARRAEAERLERERREKEEKERKEREEKELREKKERERKEREAREKAQRENEGAEKRKRDAEVAEAKRTSAKRALEMLDDSVLDEDEGIVDKPPKKRSGKATTDVNKIGGFELPIEQRCYWCERGGPEGSKGKGWPCKVPVPGVAGGRCLTCSARKKKCRWTEEESGEPAAKRRKLDDSPEKAALRLEERKVKALEAGVVELRKITEILGNMFATGLTQTRAVTAAISAAEKAGYIQVPDPEKWLKPVSEAMKLATEEDVAELARARDRHRLTSPIEDFDDDRGEGSSKVGRDAVDDSEESEEEEAEKKVGMERE